MPSLAQINDFPTVFDPQWSPTSGLIVGHDVLGGVFALNGHDPAAVDRPGVPGQMTYFAPDSLEWEAMEMGHSTWLTWLLSGRLEKFYESMRWPGWREEGRSAGVVAGHYRLPVLVDQGGPREPGRNQQTRGADARGPRRRRGLRPADGSRRPRLPRHCLGWVQCRAEPISCPAGLGYRSNSQSAATA